MRCCTYMTSDASSSVTLMTNFYLAATTDVRPVRKILKMISAKFTNDFNVSWRTSLLLYTSNISSWSTVTLLLLKHGGLVTTACNIQIITHQSLRLHRDTPNNVCVCMHVFICEIMTTLWFPKAIWFKLSGVILLFWPPVKNFDEDVEKETLIACTQCVSNGILLETSPLSHRLLFQSCRQSFIYLRYLLP